MRAELTIMGQIAWQAAGEAGMDYQVVLACLGLVGSRMGLISGGERGANDW